MKFVYELQKERTIAESDINKVSNQILKLRNKKLSLSQKLGRINTKMRELIIKLQEIEYTPPHKKTKCQKTANRN